jgi:hypothetical protein
MHYANPHPNQPPQQAPVQPYHQQQPQMSPQQFQPQMPMQQQYPQEYPQQFSPQYPQQFPQQFHLQMPQQFVPQQFPQQFQQQPQNPPGMSTTSRFTSSPATVQQTVNQGLNENSRYTNMTNSPPPQDESGMPAVFTVKPKTNKMRNNEKFKLLCSTTEVKPTSLICVPNVLATDCLQESLESLIEDAYKEPGNKAASVRSIIVAHNFYRVDISEQLKQLLSGDVKSLYKGLKTLYKEAPDKYAVCAYECIDDLLTERINDYLAINGKKPVTIDSFYSDFNELLKVLRNDEDDLEDLEELLLLYLNAYVKDMSISFENTNKPEVCSTIAEPLSGVYVDKHVLELGIEGLSDSFVKLEDTPPNVFLNSLINVSCKALNTKEFLMATLDRSIYKCAINEAGVSYIRFYQV